MTNFIIGICVYVYVGFLFFSDFIDYKFATIKQFTKPESFLLFLIFVIFWPLVAIAYAYYLISSRLFK